MVTFWVFRSFITLNIKWQKMFLHRQHWQGKRQISWRYGLINPDRFWETCQKFSYFNFRLLLCITFDVLHIHACSIAQNDGHRIFDMAVISILHWSIIILTYIDKYANIVIDENYQFENFSTFYIPKHKIRENVFAPPTCTRLVSNILKIWTH